MVFAQDSVSDWWNVGVSTAAAVLTLGALVTTIWQARRAEARATKAEARADAAEANDRYRQQAAQRELLERHIRDVVVVPVVLTTSSHGEWPVRVEVSNVGSAPLFDVQVVSDAPWLVHEIVNHHILRPGETVQLDTVCQERQRYPHMGSADISLFARVAVVATDHTGRRWVRGANGYVEQTAPFADVVANGLAPRTAQWAWFGIEEQASPVSGDEPAPDHASLF